MLASLFLLASTAAAQTNRKNGEMEDFRRSSLCLILLSHSNKIYASDIERQFLAMDLPSRYNGLNVDVRVINVDQSTSSSSIARTLKDRGVAKELVGKWFNRDSAGVMNMNRIHEWGGYNATMADLKRAQDTERGVALLTDEGQELIKNTFVMVCDINYYDRSNTSMAFGAALMAIGAASSAIAAQKGAYTADVQRNTENLYESAKGIMDIGGFTVRVTSHLFRLNWNDKLRDELYSQYWVDNTTPADEAAKRKAAFDGDGTSYGLQYIGSYYSANTGATISVRDDDPNEAIRKACSGAVELSITNLSKMFPVFKPKTPFYCENNNIYAYIGTKEGMTYKSKYEVVETRKTDNGYSYHRVAKLKPVSIWNNMNVNLAKNNLGANDKGSRFSRVNGRDDLCDQGLLLREMGRAEYQYGKKHQFYIGGIIGTGKFTKDEVKEILKTYPVAGLYKPKSYTMGGYEMGWLINYHPNIAWNPISTGLWLGLDNQEGIIDVFGSTGFVLRTNPISSRTRISLFAWPTIGIRFIAGLFKYIDTYGQEQKMNDFKSPGGLFEWGLKLGVNLWGVNVGYSVGSNLEAFSIGYNLNM